MERLAHRDRRCTVGPQPTSSKQSDRLWCQPKPGTPCLRKPAALEGCNTALANSYREFSRMNYGRDRKLVETEFQQIYRKYMNL
jgi:hypothetical protein